MKKMMLLASSLVLATAANSSFAAIYDVTVGLTAVVSGGGGGSQTGSGVGVYDSVTKVMTLTSNATVVANGLFGIGKGTMQNTYKSIFNFTSLSGTNEVTACTNVSGTNCELVPAGPQTLQSLSAINTTTNKFTAVSKFSVATTTQTWTINSMVERVTPPAVPVPAAAWMFGSALLGLAGTARRRSQMA